jgi:hypothetical protein
MCKILNKCNPAQNIAKYPMKETSAHIAHALVTELENFR